MNPARVSGFAIVGGKHYRIDDDGAWVEDHHPVCAHGQPIGETTTCPQCLEAIAEVCPGCDEDDDP